MSKIELTNEESQEFFDMVRDCVDRGMVTNNPEGKMIDEMIMRLTNNSMDNSPKVKITIELL